MKIYKRLFKENGKLPIYFDHPKNQEYYNDGDLLFREKNKNGTSYYQKLIIDPIGIFVDKNVEYSKVKPSGSWFHEDDFTVKFLNPKKLTIHVVSVDHGVIQQITSSYIPKKGWIE